MGITPPGRALPFPLVWGKPKAVESGAASKEYGEGCFQEISAPRANSLEFPDEQLINNIAAGDASALGDLIDRYSRLVMRIAVRILHDYGEAEEIMQEVFLYVYQKAAWFDAAKGTGRGW